MEMLADAELLTGFERASLPDDAFHHQEHVRVAWMFVRRHGLPDALGEFSRALKHFASAKGKPGLYHETITWAFMFLIADRLARRPTTSWEEFAAQNPDLLTWKPSVLDRYYTSETLWSDLARRTFVWPDLSLSCHVSPAASFESRPPAIPQPPGVRSPNQTGGLSVSSLSRGLAPVARE